MCLRRESPIVYIAGDPVVRYIDLYLTGFRIAIQYEKSVSLCGKGKTEMSGTGSWRELRGNTILQRNLIIMRLGNFFIMRERSRPFGLINNQFRYRHQRKYPVISHPRATLMRRLETPDRSGRVLVFPTITILPGLWRPAIHGIGNRRSRVGISPTQFVSRVPCKVFTYCTKSFSAKTGKERVKQRAKAAPCL